MEGVKEVTICANKTKLLNAGPFGRSLPASFQIKSISCEDVMKVAVASTM